MSFNFEMFAEYAKNLAARRDDGLDGDFIEEEWQFVADSDDDDEDDDLFERPKTPTYFDSDDDEDEDYDDEEDEDYDDEDDEDYDDEDDENLEEWFSEEEETNDE